MGKSLVQMDFLGFQTVFFFENLAEMLLVICEAKFCPAKTEISRKDSKNRPLELVWVISWLLGYNSISGTYFDQLTEL